MRSFAPRILEYDSAVRAPARISVRLETLAGAVISADIPLTSPNLFLHCGPIQCIDMCLRHGITHRIHPTQYSYAFRAQRSHQVGQIEAANDARDYLFICAPMDRRVDYGLP